ncbi:snRNA-activating protein complex subunit 3-like [Watersipora subatra]|uniref:snRNA-activating protein complex subunit 3-like n=1 Tax=Watersipora subatra TaxID=2589382 RepID=UPI00355B3D10
MEAQESTRSSMDWEPDLIKKMPKTVAQTLHMAGPIKVSDFLETWSTVLTAEEISMNRSESLPYHGEDVIPEEILEELFLVTNPAETLYPDGLTPFKIPKLETIPPDTKLQTVQHTLESAAEKKSVTYNHMTKVSLNYCHTTDEHLAHKHAIINVERKKEFSDNVTNDTVPKTMLVPEALISASYIRPHCRFGKSSDPKRILPIVHLHLLGQNTLADVRDAIKCPKDFEIPGDFSLAPDDARTAENAKKIMPSALFFIGETFYLDTRELKAHDYSKPIIEWLKKKGCTEAFPVKHMHKIKLSDMEIKLGMPYVFIHQGNCEHIIQFTDIRLINNDDCQTPSAYPIQLTAVPPKFTICNSCQTRANKWMVTGSILSPSDPAHYCDVCFKMLHYDTNGTKVCDFKAFRYTENDFVVSASP